MPFDRLQYIRTSSSWVLLGDSLSLFLTIHIVHNGSRRKYPIRPSEGLTYDSIAGRGADMLNCQHYLESCTVPVVG